MASAATAGASLAQSYSNPMPFSTPSKHRHPLSASHLGAPPSIPDALGRSGISTEATRARLASFQVTLDHFINEERDKIARRKAEHAKAVAEGKENTAKLSAEIEVCKKREAEVVHDIERERQELSEVKATISDLNKQMRSLSTTRESLIAEIEDYRDRIAKKRALKDQEKKLLDCQASRNAPELAFFEQKLALKLRSERQDFLTVTFTHIDDREYARSFLVEIDLRQHDYAIARCDPPLDTAPSLLAALNRTRGFYMFLKQLRAAFKDLVECEKGA